MLKRGRWAVYLGILMLTVLIPRPGKTADAEADLARLGQQMEQLKQKVLVHEAKIDQQQIQIQLLQRQIEMLKHQLDLLRNQQQDIYLDFEQRLRDDETVPVSSPSPLSETTVPKNGITDPEKSAYQQLINLIQAGHYEDTIKKFEEFLQLYPHGKYADKAQYWLGETFYALKNFDSARTTFKTLLEKHPNSPKYSEALLKMGYVCYEQKDYVAAKKFFQQVKDTYPGTGVAQLAEQRLLKLQRNPL